MRLFFKKVALAFIATWLCAAAPASPPAPLTLQLDGPVGVTAAGYAVARMLGYYAQSGIALHLLPAPPGAEPRPGADIYALWAEPALRAAAQGFALTNIAQLVHTPTLSLICRRASGIRSPEDFAHHRLGAWPGAATRALAAWLDRIGIHDATLVAIPRRPGLAGVAPLLDEKVDCQTGLSDQEYGQLQDSGLDRGALILFAFAERGLAPLEDGLWVPKASLADPARRALLARFLAESLRGWQVALDHPGLAIDAIAGPDAPATRRAALRRALATLTPHLRSPLRPLFYLEPTDYARTLTLLGPPPLPLSAWPAHAYTGAILRAAIKPQKPKP